MDVRSVVAEIAVRTPVLPLEDRIWVKLENLQPIGSFKLRGAYYAMRMLRPRAVLTASAGNMAQGVAYAARRLGIPATVVVPQTAPAVKVEAIERLGARVLRVPFDRWWRTMQERAFPGVEATFIHPCDDDLVIAGNGTIGTEILEDLPDVENVLVPWGGGGLACGIAEATRGRARVWACEVESAAPLAAALRAGRPVTIDRQPSFVDGIGGPTVFPRLFERARAVLAGALTASVEEVRAAARRILEHVRVLAEGAGACPVACAGKVRGPTVCVVSGGNMDLRELWG